MSLLVPTLFLCTLAYLLTWRRRRTLAEFQGPPSATWSKFWMVKASVSKRQNLILGECSKKYGPFARIGPNTLLISDPDYLYKVNSVRGSYIRAPAYHAFRIEVGRDSILSTRDEVRHMSLRTRMAGGYTRRENPMLERSIDRHVTRLLDLINRKYLVSPTRGFTPIDFSRVISYFTLDVITDIAFGSSANYMDADEDRFDFFTNVMTFVPIMSLMAIVPSLVRLMEIPWINKRLSPKSSDAVGIGKIMGLAKEAVEKRYSLEDSPLQDMLAAFKRHGLGKQQAETDSVFQILAGTDTTATALRGIFLYLFSSPKVLARLRDELDTQCLMPKEPLMSSTSRILSSSQLEGLSYLSACVKEGMRLHPPATGYLEKQAPPEGDVLPDGRRIPPGTGLAYCAWGIMRSRSVFGEDADLYRPERWLDTESKQLRSMHRNWELGFSSGKWKCLGKDIALMEINKVVAEFVRRYDITILDPGKPWDCTNWGLWLVRDFFFVIRARD